MSTTPNQTDRIITLDLRPDCLDAGQIAAAIWMGITTPELIAAVTGCELVDGAVVIDGAWFADDNNSEVKTTADNGEDAAQAYVDGGDWTDEAGQGCEIVVTVWQYAVDADGDYVRVNEDRHAITIKPDHDKLIKDAGGDTDCEHDWTSEGEGGSDRNPGVWSTGGTGLTIAKHCTACGLHRTEHSVGNQRNPGERDTFEYRQPETWCADCEAELCVCDE